MANTLTLNEVKRGIKQFQGFFASDMWTVKATWADQDAIDANDTLTVTMAVPGVELGDMVVGVSSSVDLSDGTDQAVLTAAVTAANVVSLYIQADKGEFAADALNNGVMKVLVARPAW
jgi:HSP20 family molecular chaperone IbpA